MIPLTDCVPLIRTDFSDDTIWESVCTEVNMPAPEMLQAFDFIKMANAHLHDDDDSTAPTVPVEIINDPQFKGATTDQLLENIPEDFLHAFLFIFDQISASQPDHPFLVVELFPLRGRTFRAIPAEIQWIESNLSVSNMDWEDFSQAVDEDGVFRGFPDAST